MAGASAPTTPSLSRCGVPGSGTHGDSIGGRGWVSWVPPPPQLCQDQAVVVCLVVCREQTRKHLAFWGREEGRGVVGTGFQNLPVSLHRGAGFGGD